MSDEEVIRECPLPIGVQDETLFLTETNERITPEEGAKEIAKILDISYEEALAEIHALPKPDNR